MYQDFFCGSPGASHVSGDNTKFGCISSSKIKKKKKKKLKPRKISKTAV